MYSEFKLWKNTRNDRLIGGEQASFCGEWRGFGQLVMAAVQESGCVNICVVSTVNDAEVCNGTAVLKPTKKRTPNSPDVFGIMEMDDGSKFKLWAWKCLKKNLEMYLAFSIAKEDGNREHEPGGEDMQMVRKHATLLAALQLWKRSGMGENANEEGIATDLGRFSKLNALEIDSLIEELNAKLGKNTVVLMMDERGVQECFSESEARVVMCSKSGKQTMQALVSPGRAREMIDLS